MAITLNIDPARNPGVLDTLTWSYEAATKTVRSNLDDLSVLARIAGTTDREDSAREMIAAARTRAVKLCQHSLALRKGSATVLASLPNGQRAFITATTNGEKPPFDLIGKLSIAGNKVYISPVNLESVAAFVTEIAPQFGPKPTGSTARLGVGNRQTVTVWPGIFEAISLVGGPAEVIQNSAYRELAPMDIILAPPSRESAYLPGHGSLSIGHTGTSIEGLWLNGVVSAIEYGFTEPYGADLDHIPVKGLDDEHLSRAKRLVDLGRHYTFFTIDASFLFNPDERELQGRYGSAIEAASEMFHYIRSLKNGQPFDFEFSLDEGGSITTPEEQEFVLREIVHRGVAVNFVAPNVGFEKRLDYRLPGGLPALEKRVRELSVVAERYGALLDFHSGSDKSAIVYQTVSRACGGGLKLKVSGKLQLILAEVLSDMDEEFFSFWWDWTLDRARSEAMLGSELGAEYVRIVEERMASEGENFRRSPKDLFFTDFSFAMVGAKDEQGRLLYRDKFYSLSQAVQDEYHRRVKDYLVALAHDLGLDRK